MVAHCRALRRLLAMGKINYGRVFLCGLLTAAVWLALIAPMIYLVGRDFRAAVQALGGSDPTTKASSLVMLITLNVVMGIWTMWLYAAIRPRYGRGPKTAALAAFALWLIGGAADGVWTLLVPIPPAALVAPGVAALLAIILAAVAGAWLYKE